MMKIKQTLVTHGVSDYKINREIKDSHPMIAGDVGVFEVVELGKHINVQLADGHTHSIFSGDLLMATFADRYATSQFEGYVPHEPLPLYHLIGAGGVVGVVKSKNAELKNIEPTTVKLIGYCCTSNGNVLNTKFYNQKRVPFSGQIKPKIILSVGSTMNSGKTTTAAFISRGLTNGGHKVGFVKLTGTAYNKDRDLVQDCGAGVVSDFNDLGYPSTYMCDKNEILDIYQTLVSNLENKSLDYVIVELADGLLQRETNFLLKDNGFMSTVHKIVLSCSDSLSAFMGVQLLREWNLEVAAIGGRVTMSPLLIREVQQQINIPVFTIDEVMTGNLNHLFVG